VTTQFVLREPVEGDIPAVNELFAASERAWYGRAFSTEADIAGMLKRPRFNLERNAWIAIEPGDSLAGYAEIWEREPGRLIEALGVVHPRSIGRGLGREFLALMEGRAAERASGRATTLRNVVPARDATAASLLTTAGYERVRRFQHMAIELGEVTTSLPAPEGVAVRAFDPGRDAAEVHTILQDAFGGTWEFKPTSFDRWRENWVEAPSFDASLWFVAEAGVEPIGAVLALMRPAGGWIIDIGVAPSWRGRGVGAALMGRVFHAFRERGVAVVELNVDAENPTGAVRLYERIGMTVTRAWDLYDKSVG
jgi:mycothiol synthase